jgi:hypothetical protein
MNASTEDACAHVASEHARVRALVAELVREALQTGRKVGHRMLRERLAALHAAVDRVVDVEERELVPLLRAGDAWGPARVERVRERHARLLGAVRAFEDEVAAERHGSCDVVSRTEEIVRALSSDLDEEREALVASQQGEGGTVVVDQEPD